MNKWESKLKKELEAGPENPELYALELYRGEEKDRQLLYDQQRREYENNLKAAKDAYEKASVNLSQAEQDVIDEKNGKLPPERGGTGLTGEGRKYQELSRRRDALEKEMQIALERFNKFRDNPVPSTSAHYNEITLDSIPENKLAPYLNDAEERKSRIDRYRSMSKSALERYLSRSEEHDADYRSVKKKYQEKINGNFDLMEKTIALYHVIFGKDLVIDDQGTQQYKWMAGLFQFVTIFGTLFLLDLIAILSKVLSRPGPYDVIVEFIEIVSYQNIRAISKEYGRYAEKWAVNPGNGKFTGKESIKTGIDLSNYPDMADFLLYSHLPDDSDTKVKVRIIGKNYRDKKDGDQSEVEIT